MCLFIYQILGNHLYPNYDWSEEKKYSPKEFLFIKGHYKSHTLSNCPIHKYSRHYITDDNQVLFDEDVEEDDTRIDNEGVALLIDALSYQYLAGSVIDYKEDLQGSRFTVENPNATTTCGCGNSFSL